MYIRQTRSPNTATAIFASKHTMMFYQSASISVFRLPYLILGATSIIKILLVKVVIRPIKPRSHQIN